MKILFCLLFILRSDTTIDSLESILEQNPNSITVIELNKRYLQRDEFNNGIMLLEKYETEFAQAEQPLLMYVLANNYFFAGRIVPAREEYLKLISRFPRSEIANDALERIYLIEQARKDTVVLKKLAYSICLLESEQFESGIDSLKVLLKTTLGAYAYYYLALLYYKQGELAIALATLQELNNSFPEHTIDSVFLLLAEVHVKLGSKKEARKILENLIIKNPASIYALQARQMLKQFF
jgi:tetratricopeptide (TPR) repeat protein